MVELDEAAVTFFLTEADARKYAPARIPIPLVPAGEEKLRALLHEWINTPFFETHADWLKWVQEFRPRVDAALGAAPG